MNICNSAQMEVIVEVEVVEVVEVIVNMEVVGAKV